MSDSGMLLQIPGAAGEKIDFSMEPIVLRHDHSVYAYELLYRGPHPCNFVEIDQRLVAWLGSCAEDLPPLFVNLSNDTMDTACDEALIRASRGARVFFELSERHMESATFDRVARRVNALSRKGVRFALDDFGAGHDALSRLLAMDSVSMVKLDGSLLGFAGRRAPAARLLKSLCDVMRGAGIRTIAECIEVRRHLELAEYLGIDMLQGYLLNAMVTAEPARA
jgi:EAL domain-containing protein (putative c-di-GMP-specific phosphodiesterase class I)